MAEEITRKVLRNTSFLFAGRLWFLGLNILLTPYLLSRLGVAAYGVWVLVDSLARTVALVDLGFATSFVKHVAENDARGNREGVSGVLSTGLAFYALVSLVMLAVAVLGVEEILAFFRVPADLEGATRSTLTIVILASIAGNVIGVYHSVINGLQRMDVSNVITVAMSVFYALGCVIALETGLGIVGLGLNLLATQLLGSVVSHRAAHRLYPGLRFTPREIPKHWSALLRYGLNLHLSGIASLVNAHFDKLLVNRFIGASHVAFYDVGSRPAMTARSFAVLLLSSLTPAASELEVRKGRGALYELFASASRYVSLIAIPVFATLIVVSRPLTEAWVGPGYDSSVTVLRLLAIGFLLYSLAATVSPLVQATGVPHYQRNAETVGLVLNIVFSIVLVKRFGFYGAPVGTAMAISLSSTYYLWTFHRYMKRPLLVFVEATFWSPVVCSLAAGVVAAAVIHFLGPLASGSRVLSLLLAAVGGLIFSLGYVLLILQTGFLDRDQARWLRSRISLERLHQRQQSKG